MKSPGLSVSWGGGRPSVGPTWHRRLQLFYKATSSELRAKDGCDLAAALPLLNGPARRWLDEALAVVRPDHPWRDRLVSGGTGQRGQ